jgi:CRP/FNR family cyclic AMP-dependent transcriptional regulator
VAEPGTACRDLQLEGPYPMVELPKPTFNVVAFLAGAGLGRRIVQIPPKHTFFLQGDIADSVFYLRKGRARVTVVSHAGKEATITLVQPGEFVGEGALAEPNGLRLSTATAITACTALKITRDEMVRVMHEEHAFSDMFLKFLLERSMRIQADLVDQLFNSSEKRLARILLLMAEFGHPGDNARDNIPFQPPPVEPPGGKDRLSAGDGESAQFIPRISQETLAEMIGTTRSRVSFFMNRFRKLGLIEYHGRIKVHKSLLNVILHDNLPGDNAHRPEIEGPE